MGRGPYYKRKYTAKIWNKPPGLNIPDSICITVSGGRNGLELGYRPPGKTNQTAFGHLIAAFNATRVPRAKIAHISPRDFSAMMKFAIGEPKLQIEFGPGAADLIRDDADLMEREAAGAVDVCEGLYPYQRDGAAWLATQRRGLLADQMGLGKTIQALAAIPRGVRTIVVCPAGMRLTWLEESKRWRPDISWIVATKLEQIPTSPENHTGLIIGPHLIPKLLKSIMSECSVWDKSSLVVIADEAHMYKNPESGRSQNMTKLCKLAHSCWALTGTPLVDKPPDLIGMLQTFGLFGRAFVLKGMFYEQFGRYEDKDTGAYAWPSVPPHSDEIAAGLSRVALRRTRGEVLPELPTKSYARVLVDIKSGKSRLEELTRACAGAFEAVDHGGLESLKPGDYAAIGALRKALSAEKIGAMMEFVDRCVETSEPLVVISANSPPLEALRQAGYPVITGKDSDTKRHRAVKDFQNGRAPIIGIQTVAGGVGITLTRANNVLMVQRDWTPSINEQAEDRMCRIGQMKPVTVWDLLANHPLDERISELLLEKQTRITATVERMSATQSSVSERVQYMRELAEYAEKTVTTLPS